MKYRDIEKFFALFIVLQSLKLISKVTAGMFQIKYYNMRRK